MKKTMILLATFFGVGYLPLAPGTWASLFTTIIVYLLLPLLKGGWWTILIALPLVTALGIPAAAAAEKHFSRKDPRPCVIDEVAGQMTALLFIPHNPFYFATAFLLFRVFDILKPFPIRQSERLPRGIGIMIDDLLAGAYALLILHLAKRFLF